ncbi:MAG TPA: styrene monooxygenase/indole monooxygenase family protein [Streptosporangiaceae bacterium]|nr:styrene monooxygenase/indole monooxygenase family protein [Streptosporangiaceae bacterium]
MARRILVVGAGQSGLQLALGLQQHDYDVTVMSARTADEIRGGRVMSTQAMFHRALKIERDLGLNFWEDECPKYDHHVYTLRSPDGGLVLDYAGQFTDYAQSVDQRVKMSGWLEEFENRGGKVVIHGVTVSDLDRLVPMYDLTIVAAGKGELVRMFGRNPGRSPYTQPQRSLAVAYVHGMGKRPDYPDIDAVYIDIVAGLGEMYVIPGLTTTGPCDILLVEGVPGGEFDSFSGARTGEEVLRRILDLRDKYSPQNRERTRNVGLTDCGGFLTGRYTPVVRYPVGRLPGGGIVLGMADVVVANDPITGQGSNNAAHCAAIYQQAILDHGDRPFDEEFMEQTFGKYWDYAQYVTIFTNAFLQPPPPHVMELLIAGTEHKEIRDRFTEGFAYPPDFFDWFMDPEKARAYLAEVTGRDNPP